MIKHGGPNGNVITTSGGLLGAGLCFLVHGSSQSHSLSNQPS